MSDWLKTALEKNSAAWLVIVVLLLMVGPTGIEKMFDRFFPPPQDPMTAIDLDHIGKKSDKIEYVIRNQNQMLQHMKQLLQGFNRMERDVDDLDMRLTGVEAWRVFQDATIRDRNP